MKKTHNRGFEKNGNFLCKTKKPLLLADNLESPYVRSFFSKSQYFFPYRKSFLCYWLLPFVGFTYMYILNKGFLISYDDYFSTIIDNKTVVENDRLCSSSRMFGSNKQPLLRQIPFLKIRLLLGDTPVRGGAFSDTSGLQEQIPFFKDLSVTLSGSISFGQHSLPFTPSANEGAAIEPPASPWVFHL
ncbi:MAG: hypothetical protein ACT6RN_26765 [Agrobacterium sp.]|uniref:hypothetical protein n=1 Tax=Agrobacterium sp. TaxID=361 RepID=UPI004037AFA6